MRLWFIAATAGLLLSTPALAQNNQGNNQGNGNCSIPSNTVNNVQSQLAKVVNLPDANGGLFKPNRMWSAIVDRKGVLCSVISSNSDAWPGSRLSHPLILNRP